MNLNGYYWAKLFLLVLSLSTPSIDCVLQTLVLDVSFKTKAPVTMLASQAFFLPIPSMKIEDNPRLQLIGPPPASNEHHFLCDVEESTTYPMNSMVMIPRGVCSFKKKVLNAQTMGASAVLIYGALEGRYQLNVTNETDYKYTVEDIVYPADKLDYDCSLGQASIPSSELSFEPLPYNAMQNNRLLSGDSDTNLCKQLSKDNLMNCPSQACLLTGKQSGSSREACCAWDLPVWLYDDRSIEEKTTIPAAYVTMEQANELFGYMGGEDLQHVRLYARWKPAWNVSSGVIWALGVFVAALAAYLTADDYRRLSDKVLRAQNRQRTSPEQGSEPRPVHRPSTHPDDTLELTPIHAVGFIVLASSSLMILFYFKIYGVVKVMYAFGCSNALAQVILQPLLNRLRKHLGTTDPIAWRTGTEDFGDIRVTQITSFMIAYIVALAWLIVAFTDRNADARAFFWITQNIFGSCMCIMFLKTIRLNSIEVASMLLIVAFFYDIFFVFITPYIFSKSVMITVATSGGPPKADASWCEKYPDDSDCQGGNPLPMLLTIPRFFDYQGGASLLGLGDIVLPGLLISFAARYDAAKSLVGIMGGGSGRIPASCPQQRLLSTCFCFRGYFGPLVIAYAIGLFMANAAVYLMEMGQPALLYLVPCCLGTMSYIGWRQGELKDLWDGPRAIKTADATLYGEDTSGNSESMGVHAPLPSDDEDGDGLISPPSAIDDDDEINEGVALT